MTKLIWILFLPLIIFPFSAKPKIIQVEDVNLIQKKQPLFASRSNKGVVKLHFILPEHTETRELIALQIYLTENSQPEFLKKVEVEHLKTEDKNNFISIFGNTSHFKTNRIIIGGSETIKPGNHTFSFDFFRRCQLKNFFPNSRLISF